MLQTEQAPPKDFQANRIIHERFRPLFDPYRYKVYWGGRGGMKSWQIARALLAIAHTCDKRLLIGCFREFQNTIADSVHKLLCDQMDLMGLREAFNVTQATIRSLTNGSYFIFKGLHANATEIKSMEGLNIVWVEEAQLVSEDSWQILIPTVRGEGWQKGTVSEIWISFNPVEETDATYQRFIVNTPPNALVVKVGWQHNPWMSEALEMERQYMANSDPDAYEHVWNGSTKTIGDACIFKKRYCIETFEPPDDALFYRGLDFGFAEDPLAMTSVYQTGKFPNEHLWIHEEAFGFGVELDETVDFLKARVQEVERWPIHADCARPESISYLARHGLPVSAAEKWSGSVEDGISHLKAFKMIHIHARCQHTQQEARLYSFKVDKAGNILPIVVDKHNHGWDATRYALDGFIQRRGAAALWARLAE